jgi:hypothetical protein
MRLKTEFSRLTLSGYPDFFRLKVLNPDARVSIFAASKQMHTPNDTHRKSPEEEHGGGGASAVRPPVSGSPARGCSSLPPGGAREPRETCIPDLCRRDLATAAAEVKACGDAGEDGDADLDQTLDASILRATGTQSWLGWAAGRVFLEASACGWERRRRREDRRESARSGVTGKMLRLDTED